MSAVTHRPSSRAIGAIIAASLVLGGALIASPAVAAEAGVASMHGSVHAGQVLAIVDDLPLELASSVPAIVGDVRVGETLTAVPGTWTEGTAFAYQWAVNGTPVDGSTEASFLVPASSAGAAITVTTTGTMEGFATVSRTSVATEPVANGRLSAATPIIAGMATVGSILSVEAGTWPEGTALTYQWFADGIAIDGAVGDAYEVQAAQKGKALSVEVTGTITGYENTLTSAATAKVPTVATPTISGTAVTGSTLTAKPNTWTTGTAFTYQWFADGIAIDGATKSTYAPDASRDGVAITVRVTGAKSEYETIDKTSAPTPKVLRVSTPKVTGTVAYGSTLTVDRGTWSADSSFKQQWYADGNAIAGATSTTLKLTSGLKGKSIKVKVTGSKAEHPTVATTSASTGKVTTAATPSITGTRAVGATLAASRGTWAAGTTFSYQWYADGAAISGATKSTYVLSSAREHDQIKVKVTGRKSGYATVAKTSSVTSKIMRAGTPSISGTRLVTKRLTASTGTWTSSVTFSYQWYANGAAISGATSKTLTLTSKLAGKTIKVKVTGKRSGYATIAKSSTSTSVIGYPNSTSPVSLQSCPSWAPIKGNESSMIYHMPWQRYYDATHPEACFRTESAARNAGYRAAKV